ncbi:MAG: hypothetical protein ABJG88_00530 [Litorimonas sp.]
MTPIKSHKSSYRSAFMSVTALCFAGLFLTSCGVRGSLKTPPPIWGADKPAQTNTTSTTNTPDTSASSDTDLNTGTNTGANSGTNNSGN